MEVRVKICGLTEEAAVRAACEAGAAYLGFVFYPPSPRAVTPERAADLIGAAPSDRPNAGLCTVGLFVDPDDRTLEQTLAAAPLAMIQLHGQETPERVRAVRMLTGLPVMKAVSIGRAEDLPWLDACEAAADQILCDAKPRPGEPLPGGNGVAFDWRLIAGRRWRRPWMLAGGLTVENVAAAVALTGARQVDVSSGVEDRPGRKNPEKIRAFVAAAQCGAETSVIAADSRSKS